MANYYQRAINAVFYANPVKLQQLIDEGHFYTRLLEDCGLLAKPFPIWRITQCWEAAMGDDPTAFSESCRAEVTDFMARNRQVKEIFQKTLHVEFTPIVYQDYWENFYCMEPYASVEDIIDYTPKALAKVGTRQIDIDLYCAVEKFEFSRVIELLKAGANPNANMTTDEDDESTALDRIGMECSYLCTCQLSFAWSPKNHTCVGHHEIGDLVGWAAHETMSRCLEQYSTWPVESYDTDDMIIEND